MTATVLGELRKNSTYGEKQVLKKLRPFLPNEFSIYVECPIDTDRQITHPDFIVLTNYGVIIIEVKDWVQIQSADRYGVKIITRQNKVLKLGNPVEIARNYALDFQRQLKEHKRLYDQRIDTKIPWGYCVVLPNLSNPVKTQLQRVWGKDFVFNLNDLESNIILKRLRRTISTKFIDAIEKRQMDLVRSVINPQVTFKIIDETRPPIILDEIQEKIVMEPVREVEEPKTKKEDLKEEPQALFEFSESTAIEEIPQEEDEIIPDVERVLIQNISLRLVRGVAGSGKTLVLEQRAKYLSRNHPDWDILVLTYNTKLHTYFSKTMRGYPQITTTHFHKLCKTIIQQNEADGWKNVIQSENWLQGRKNDFDILNVLNVTYVADEIKWIKDVQIQSRDEYLTAKRLGRGTEFHLSQLRRHQIYDVLLVFEEFLKKQRQLSWEKIPEVVLDGIRNKNFEISQYDAILIDEAQDFAPSWISVVSELIKEDGTLFLADDPAQSIYRYFSWRQKGVHVVGRTRRLRIPYRNTRQIYDAAYNVIKNDDNIIQSIKKEGAWIEPDLTSELMRNGNKPLLKQCSNIQEEVMFIEDSVNELRQKENIPFHQIGVFHPKKSGNDVKIIRRVLQKYKIQLSTCQSQKGLEYSAVIFCGLHNLFPSQQNKSESYVSVQRRMVYMAMTRARDQLYLTYQKHLPEPLETLENYVDHITN